MSFKQAYSKPTHQQPNNNNNKTQIELEDSKSICVRRNDDLY
jgi:hypothetical protein